MKYIGRKMIEDGLMAKVIEPRLTGGGLIAQIGEYWFFFGGSEFERTNPKDIPFDVLVEEIKCVLDAFNEDEFYKTEYLYYYCYLCEHI